MCKTEPNAHTKEEAHGCERRWSRWFSVLAALALPLGAAAQPIPLGDEFQVATHTLSAQRFPSVAADADGDFVVAWDSQYQDDSSYGVFARRFSSVGDPLATEFQVNTYVTDNQLSPSVTADADGDFVVAWISYDQDGDRFGVFARHFSSTGAPRATELQVNTYTTDNQASPSVSADAGGGFVVAWRSDTQDGDSNGIFAQRFAPPLAVLDIDGNGAVGPLTDGLLVLRFLFGFTGPTLTGGAVGSGCTRCDSGAIQPYLETLI